MPDCQSVVEEARGLTKCGRDFACAARCARVASDAPAGRDEAPVQAAASHVDLSSLPAAGAIHWGNPKGERLVVFSDFQCGYCQRLKGQMSREGIAWEEVDIEAVPDAAAIVERVNNGNQTVPTLVYSDGTAMTNPSLAQVQEKLAALA